jgi:regulator of replication initiation timing
MGIGILSHQIKTIEQKVQLLRELVIQLKSENLNLKGENAVLMRQVEARKTTEISMPVDQELFAAQVTQAKKVKREVELALRDAERKLEALRF